MDVSYQTYVEPNGRHIICLEARPGHMVPILDRRGEPFDFRPDFQKINSHAEAQAFLGRVLGASAFKPSSPGVVEPAEAATIERKDANEHSRDAFAYAAHAAGYGPWTRGR